MSGQPGESPRWLDDKRNVRNIVFRNNEGKTTRCNNVFSKKKKRFQDGRLVFGLVVERVVRLNFPSAGGWARLRVLWPLLCDV